MHASSRDVPYAPLYYLQEQRNASVSVRGGFQLSALRKENDNNRTLCGKMLLLCCVGTESFIMEISLNEWRIHNAVLEPI